MIGRPLAGLFLILAGCAPATPPAEDVQIPKDQPPAAGSCDAAKAQSFVGERESAAIAEQARQKSGARTVRWLRPGQIVTMEYRDDRLSLQLDARGTIIAIRCG
jgi:hypothetical protein